MRQARLRRGAHHIAQRHRRGADLFQEELQPQRTEVLAVVAVFRLGRAPGLAGLELHPAPILVHALAGLLVDEFNLRPVDLVERHARFARLNLRLERLVELVQRGLLQIHELRQVQVVEFLEMMPQRGIHLGFAGRRIEDVIVAHALLLREFDRQQQQRRVDALVRRFLEVVPAQETQHQPELGKAILGAVAPRLADDLVEHAGDVGRVLEAQVFAQRHRRALGHGGGQFRMPDEELLQLDVAVIQQHRHGRDGEVQRLERGLEIDEPVAPRDFEQPVAQMRLNQPPLAGDGRIPGIPSAKTSVEIQVGRLLAVILQPRNHLAEILARACAGSTPSCARWSRPAPD